MSGATLAFLGTGEAFDTGLPHTSMLLRTPGTSLLLDCGALVPPRLWQEMAGDRRSLDAVWISHLHADHAFGIPALLGRMWEEGRQDAITVLGAEGIAARALALLDQGYPGIRERLAFDVREVAVEPGAPVPFRDLRLRSAPTRHSLRNLAVRIELAGGGAVTYSGDGAPTEQSRDLGAGAWWVHECFTPSEAPTGHADLETLRGAAATVRPVRLGLVHCARGSRAAIEQAVAGIEAGDVPVEVVRAGARWSLP